MTGSPTAPCRSTHRALAVGLLCAGSAAPFLPAAALEFGVEARTQVQASDNIDQANAGLEEDGSFGFAGLGIFGEQTGRVVRGAFTGEIDARKRLDEDDDVDTLSRFLGAVEIQLTPRVFSWYAGDVLGSVRSNDRDQPISDFDTQTRNVFVTGPQAQWQIDAANRFDARLLYVNQTADNAELATLYSGFAEFERERISGRRIGLRLSDVFTDASRVDDEQDSNRASLTGFIERERGFWTAGGEVGVTRFDTDEESINGLVAQLNATRRLGPFSAATVQLRRDLSDRTLGTLDGLLSTGAAAQQEEDGIFEQTRLEASYSRADDIATADVGIGVAMLDFRIVDGGTLDDDSADELDQVESYLFANLSRALTPRLRLQAGARYERETFDNVADESDSVFASLGASYRISRSFQLDLNYLFDRLTGIESVDGMGGRTLADVDRTENRVGLGLRWAPPSRASQDLTVELKSLVR